MSDLYLLRATLRDLTRTRKVIAALLLVALAPVIAILWRVMAPSGEYSVEVIYNQLTELLVFGFVLVILAVVFSTGVITQEVEQKTIVYLLTRPVRRWRILLIKFAAAFAVTTVTVWIALLLLALTTYGPRGLGGSRLGRDLLIAPIGVLAYGGLFLMLATLIRRSLVFGLLFAFGWEAWVPNWPGSFRKTSLMTYLRVLAPHPKPEPDVIDVQALLNAREASSISMPFAWSALIGVIVVSLAAAFVLFSTREYVPRDDAE